MNTNLKIPCIECNLKGICIDKIIQGNRCVQYDIYDREVRYPNIDETYSKWLTTGVMIDEDIRIDKDDLVDELYMNYFRDSNLNYLHLYKEALSCILGNLVINGNLNKPLSKPLKKNSRFEYKWFKQSIIDNILKVLVDNGFCLYWKGFLGQSAKYFLTLELINKYYNTKMSKPTEYIIMNKPDKNNKQKKLYIKPPYTPMYIKMSNDIKFINNLLCKATVKFKFDDKIYNRPEYKDQLNMLVKCNYLFQNNIEYEIDKNSLFIFRVFTRGDYRFGGRFYTKIFQGIPSEVRSTITIDGEETVELDYSAQHLRMLYHKEGIDFKGEIYVYSKNDKTNADKRLINKKIAMIAINAKSKKSAIGAVINALIEDNSSGKFNSNIPTYKELCNMYDNFLEHHKPIAKYVGADMGIKLQRLDSDIMNDILVELTKNNIIALPIHDSLVVQKKHQEILKDKMSKQYYKYLHYYPTIPNISHSPNYPSTTIP